MTEITLTATVDNDGLMQYERKELLAEFLKANGYARVEVVIRPIDEAKTGKQVRSYWGVLIPTIIEFRLETDGEVITPTEVHFQNKILFGLKPNMQNILGYDVFTFDTVSMAAMSKKELTYFIDVIVKYYIERGMIIDAL